MKTITTKKYRENFSAWLRKKEEHKARGDVGRLEDLAASGDDYLLKRWLWTMCLVQVPVAFVVIPFMLSMLSHYIAAAPAQILWGVAKVFMALSLLLFVATAVFTSRAE